MIVTHTASLKAMLSHIESRPLAELWQPPFIHPTALCKVVVAEGLPTIELYGDISHFRDDAAGQ
jgi:phosphoserine phosphatase